MPKASLETHDERYTVSRATSMRRAPKISPEQFFFSTTEKLLTMEIGSTETCIAADLLN